MFLGLLSTWTKGNFDETLGSNSEAHLIYISLNNRLCQARSTLVNINSNQPLLYPFTVSFNKCGGSCNTNDDPYAQVCVPNKVNNLNVKNVKILNLMSGVNAARFLVQLESWECKCGLNKSVCNSK